MRSAVLLPLCLSLVLLVGHSARADIGWSEEQYNQVYGKGQKGFGKGNDRSYKIGENYLVVEFTPDNSSSLGELWVLGVVRDNIPDNVTKAGDAAAKGQDVERVTFTARSSIPAEIRETVIDDIVVRVDVRNQMISRIAFCGKKPECGLWRRIFGPPCESKASCPVLERALGVDRTMDEMHRRAEAAVEHLHAP